jgi:sodium/bile acid cotransporter 7
VQSSIALTSLARGNVPAAVCAASASTLLGIALTPWLAGWVLGPQASAAAGVGSGLDAVGKVMLQLLLPFVAGHLLQPWVGGWVKQRARLLKGVDQGSIMLVVYTAFSAAVSEGLWRQVPLSALAGLLLISALLLALALLGMTLVARKLGFAKADEITIVFCGSKKSLASGVPMANVLFPAAMVGPVLLPVMIFHQIQLMVCAHLAQRYNRRID